MKEIVNRKTKKLTNIEILKLPNAELFAYWRTHYKEPFFTRWLDSIQKKAQDEEYKKEIK